MKKLIVTVSALLGLVLVASSGQAQPVPTSRFCSGLQPICINGQVACACDNLGDNCSWVCVHN